MVMGVVIVLGLALMWVLLRAEAREAAAEPAEEEDLAHRDDPLP